MFKPIILFSIFINISQAEIAPPHIEPDGGRFSAETIKRIETQLKNKIESKSISPKESEELSQISMLLNIGRKASKWIEIVNATRSDANKLDMSSSPTTGGIPITAPNKTNTEILMKRYDDFLSQTNSAITDYIKEDRELPSTLPVKDEEFVKAMKTLDRLYQHTVRWSGSLDWLSWYTKRAINDLRGYIFLSQNPDIELNLKDFNKLDIAEQNKLTSLLITLCNNGDFGINKCTSTLNKAIRKNKVADYYTHYLPYGKSVYDRFFTVKKTRPEIKWNEAKTLLESPFRAPEKTEVQNWLKENVEDEWKTQEFNLMITFIPNAKNIPRIQFQEGVTANVNGIAGDLITMEAEYPIETASQKWTIRHEYGHVLGFEDCYLEFYDKSEKAMIYYEIDVDNLMCSRNGHLKTTHYQQLFKAYK